MPEGIYTGRWHEVVHRSVLALKLLTYEPPDAIVAAPTGSLPMQEKATIPGRTLADAFEDCRHFYAEAGFQDEWKLHHQGGTTGYGSREVIATPQTPQEIQAGQAFAWNPSVTGAKTEETFIHTESGPEMITPAPDEGRAEDPR